MKLAAFFLSCTAVLLTAGQSPQPSQPASPKSFTAVPTEELQDMRKSIQTLSERVESLTVENVELQDEVAALKHARDAQAKTLDDLDARTNTSADVITILTTTGATKAEVAKAVDDARKADKKVTDALTKQLAGAQDHVSLLLAAVVFLVVLVGVVVVLAYGVYTDQKKTIAQLTARINSITTNHPQPEPPDHNGFSATSIMAANVPSSVPPTPAPAVTPTSQAQGPAFAASLQALIPTLVSSPTKSGASPWRFGFLPKWDKLTERHINPGLPEIMEDKKRLNSDMIPMWMTIEHSWVCQVEADLRHADLSEIEQLRKDGKASYTSLDFAGLRRNGAILDCVFHFEANGPMNHLVVFKDDPLPIKAGTGVGWSERKSHAEKILKIWLTWSPELLEKFPVQSHDTISALAS